MVWFYVARYCVSEWVRMCYILAILLSGIQLIFTARDDSLSFPTFRGISCCECLKHIDHLLGLLQYETLLPYNHGVHPLWRARCTYPADWCFCDMDWTIRFSLFSTPRSHIGLPLHREISPYMPRRPWRWNVRSVRTLHHWLYQHFTAAMHIGITSAFISGNNEWTRENGTQHLHTASAKNVKMPTVSRNGRRRLSPPWYRLAFSMFSFIFSLPE